MTDSPDYSVGANRCLNADAEARQHWTQLSLGVSRLFSLNDLLHFLHSVSDVVWTGREENGEPVGSPVEWFENRLGNARKEKRSDLRIRSKL